MRIFNAFCLSLAIFATTSLSSFAEETSDTADNGTPKATLTGGVQIEDTLNLLQDARLSVSRVRAAASNLYDEMTRRQMTMTYSPNAVGQQLLWRPTPTFSGNYLPARPKWVKESMAEIGPIIKLFKEDVDAAIESDRRTEVSAAARKKLDPLREKAFASVKTSFDLYAELEKLTSGSSYNNMTVASKTKDLNDQMKQLDQSFKRGIKILQKEAKSSKRA